ncbi:hypothetical protein ACFL10_00285 [Patescibacteria group bacterium]
MENSNKEQFDAQLVLVADDDIEKSEIRLYHHQINVIPAHQVLNYALKIKKGKDMGESEAVLKMVFGDLDKKLNELKEEFGEEVVNIILNGRLRMSILLNSEEGIIAAGDHRRKYMDYVKSKEGKVESYLKFAAGGGAEMFLDSDERIIAPWSGLLCTPIQGGTPDFVEERYDRLKLLIACSADKDQREKLDEKIHEIEDENPDNPQFNFNSAELVDFGIAHTQVADLNEMRELFLQRTGITLLPAGLSDEFEIKIKNFFKDE